MPLPLNTQRLSRIAKGPTVRLWATEVLTPTQNLYFLLHNLVLCLLFSFLRLRTYRTMCGAQLISGPHPHDLLHTHIQISTLESILQSAQGTLRTLLGEGAKKTHRKQSLEPPHSSQQTTGCGEGRGQWLVVAQNSSPAGLQSSRKPTGAKSSPLTTKGPRRVEELLPPRRVPGAPWSLSQAVRNKNFLHVENVAAKDAY